MKKFFFILSFILISSNAFGFQLTKCFTKNEFYKTFEDSGNKRSYVTIDTTNGLVTYVWINKETGKKTVAPSAKITYIDSETVKASAKLPTHINEYLIDLVNFTVNWDLVYSDGSRDHAFFFNCENNNKQKTNYLDYWWAVILIIAITFFIFTQSGKRLKKIRRK